MQGVSRGVKGDVRESGPRRRVGRALAGSIEVCDVQDRRRMRARDEAHHGDCEYREAAKTSHGRTSCQDKEEKEDLGSRSDERRTPETLAQPPSSPTWTGVSSEPAGRLST